MNENERLELLFKLKRHKVKMKDAAEALDVSSSLLSQYLNYKCNMSLENENELLKFVDELDANNGGNPL